MNAPSIEAIMDICKEAANAILERRGAAAQQAGEAFPVTDADRASSAVFEERLGAFGFPVVSEENDLQIPAQGTAWVVDPLDGTTDFTRGSPDWCIMVALVKDRVVKGGVVYAPDHTEWWHAFSGKGAFYSKDGNERRIDVSNVDDPRQARMMMSATHPSERAQNIVASLGARSVSTGSMGIKLGRIAMGEAECYWSAGHFGEWDICAPSIILTEAGGTISNTHGEAISLGNQDRHIHDGIVASNGKLHTALLNAGVR